MYLYFELVYTMFLVLITFFMIFSFLLFYLLFLALSYILSILIHISMGGTSHPPYSVAGNIETIDYPTDRRFI